MRRILERPDRSAAVLRTDVPEERGDPTGCRVFDGRQDVLGPDVAYQVVGSAPADHNVRTASERAVALGVTKIQTVVVQGKPGEVLPRVVREQQADLLVVGNRGLNSLAGRIVGSVPLDLARHSTVDVLIVHTT